MIMKKTFLTLMLLLFILTVNAQTSDTVKATPDTTTYLSVDHMPEFPGGLKEFYKYLAGALRYPFAERRYGIQGRVFLQMIIEKDGTVSNVKVMRSLSPPLDAEAVKVLSESPKWIPGLLNGKAVRVVYSMPIAFKLSR